MTLDDLFPPRGHVSWQTATVGYHPNNATTAQSCTACGALVDCGAALADGTNPTDMRPTHLAFHMWVEMAR